MVPRLRRGGGGGGEKLLCNAEGLRIRTSMVRNGLCNADSDSKIDYSFYIGQNDNKVANQSAMLSCVFVGLSLLSLTLSLSLSLSLSLILILALS